MRITNYELRMESGLNNRIKLGLIISLLRKLLFRTKRIILKINNTPHFDSGDDRNLLNPPK